MTSPTVTIGYAHNGSHRAEFVESLVSLIWEDARYALENGRSQGLIDGTIGMGGPYIPHNRNRVVEHFLTQTTSDWLWFLDNDIDFPADVIGALLHVADPVERPIVGALYFAKITNFEHNACWPIWMERNDTADSDLNLVYKVRRGELRELTAVGMGCTLIHRSVLEKMREAYADDPWHWFGHDVYEDDCHGRTRIGEDVTFCVRAKNMGIPVYGLAYPVDHMKTMRVGWEAFAKQCKPTPGTVLIGDNVDGVKQEGILVTDTLPPLPEPKPDVRPTPTPALSKE